MKIPTIQKNDERPALALPRYTQFVVIGAIAVLILLATFWSGGKPPRKPEDRTAAPVQTSAAQVQSFQQTLERERQRQEAERAQKSLAQIQTTLAPVAAPVSMSPTVADPIIDQNRKRIAAAPFASSYVVKAAPEVLQEIAAPDLSTQIVALTNASTGKGSPPNFALTSQVGALEPVSTASKPGAPERPKESGRSLPPKEGDLYRLYEGTQVQARLANRLDGSFTGPVDSVVSTAVLAQDKTVTLIPAGSRFLGKASRVEAENQTRLAVTFKRLILPNGYSIDLEAAPGLDGMGETGLKGKVENHNLRKFGLSGAVGLLGGLALYGGLANPYTAGVANSTGNSATNILNHALNVVPTITVPEGHPVNVYLPGDLLLPPYRP